MLEKAGLFTIKELIVKGDQDPDHNAIESPGYQPLTYRDLRHQILSVVKILNAMGFHRNDRLAIIMPDCPETAVIIISVMAGFTAVPLNLQNTEQEYETYFSHLRIKGIIVQKSTETAARRAAELHNIPVIELKPLYTQAGRLELESAVLPETHEAEFATSSDIATILLTSGTTSRAKIVPVSQKQFFLSKQKNCQLLNITNTDRCLHILPYSHGWGFGTPLMGSLLSGGTVICTKDFIPSDFLSLLKKYRPTFYSAGPALHQSIIRKIKNVSPDELKNNSLRFIRSGSAALPEHVRRELERLLGVPVIQSFGTSETGTIAINLPPKQGSVGIPVIEGLKIMDENGNSLGPYSEGEILVKGETVFNGYEGDSDENNNAFTNEWFRTGDTGYLDNEGYLFLTGRKKELINKGGAKISPAEIDAVLKTFPGVLEVMAFGVPDPVLGEEIAVMVVPSDAHITEADLRLYLLDHLIPFKVPRRIYFVDQIPKTPTGKPVRSEGKKRYS
jgi:oxalate---CoA ligase